MSSFRNCLLIYANEIDHHTTRIYYTSSAKLAEVTSTGSAGLHTNAFGSATMLSHTWNNGVGRVDFDIELTTVGTCAFYGASVTSVLLPKKVTSIGSMAFRQCTSMISINMPSSLTSIGNYAFLNCSSLKMITIPSYVSSIGMSAFESCSALLSITVNRNTPPTLDEDTFSDTNNCPIYVPDSVIDDYKDETFWCDYAERIHGKFDDNELWMASDSNSFTVISSGWGASIISQQEVEEYYWYMYVVTFNGSPTTIPTGGVESDSENIDEITMPSSIKTISNYAIRRADDDYLDGITKMICKATVPPTLSSNGFSRCGTIGAIYVPLKSVDRYKNETNWANYGSVIKGM